LSFLYLPLKEVLDYSALDIRLILELTFLNEQYFLVGTWVDRLAAYCLIFALHQGSGALAVA
jgi:hypothetical protein